MAIKSVTLTQSEQAKDPCPCGCAPCDGTCCGLDCLVRPHFFCGQLLTDQDLNALLGWTQDKFRLARYTDGWGVVCGLDVSCDAEAGWIAIEPGYAVSCCGDDIVVCETDRLDLRQYCTREKDECASLEQKQPDKRKIDFGFCEFPAAEVRLLDLYISYDEKKEDPVTALGRTSCHEVAECEYSRTREHYRLVPRPAYSGSNPVKVAADAWRRSYDRCLDVLNKFQQKFGAPEYIDDDTAESMRKWLSGWLTEHPLHHFCFLHDCICDGETFDLTDVCDLVKILFWIVQDCRNSFCDCHSCSEDENGVPLARIWIHMPEDDRERPCRVIHIDAYPPYRRLIQRDCWPAPLGKVNAAQVLWHWKADACATLSDLGVIIAGSERLTLPCTIAGLYDLLDCDPFVACNEPIILQTYDDIVKKPDALGHDPAGRVVGFCAARDESGIDLSVTKGGPESARPGERIKYTIRVQNYSQVGLNVVVSDEMLDINQTFWLDPADSPIEIKKDYDVPEDAPNPLVNEVKVVGTARDSRSVTSTDDWSVQIIRDDGYAVSGDRVVNYSTIGRRDIEGVRGIGPTYAKRLHGGGIERVEQLLETDIKTLMEIAGVRETVARNWLMACRQMLEDNA
jgi:uncharacterized repeat protein (TIGR01451 family)